MVMDNASVHHANKVAELIHGRGALLRFYQPTILTSSYWKKHLGKLNILVGE